MKLLYAFISIVLLASCAQDEPAQEPDRNAVEQLDSLHQIIDSLKNRNLDLLDQLTAMEAAKAAVPGLLFSEDFIKDQLRKRKDLIPIEGVLGGSMRYTSFRILSKHWIMAVYEDGHIQGASLLRFDAEKDSTLKFKTLDHIEHY